jgi:ketosteroid isomerase-like protein
MKKVLFTALIASSLFACKSETKPAFDLANAKKEIEAADQALVEFMAKGDSVGMAAAYSKDGLLMLNNMPSVKGNDQLATVWGSFIRAGVSKLTLTTLEVWGDENFVTEEGLFEIKTKDDAQIDKGKYLVLWKKEDGKWKVHRDISNTDLPAATK